MSCSPFSDLCTISFLFSLTCFSFIHYIESLLLHCIYLLFIRCTYVPYSILCTHISFMHHIYSSFMYQCLSLEHFRPVYLLGMYHDKHIIECSEDCYSWITLTYCSCIAFFYYLCIIYMISCSLACFLFFSFIKSSF